jgi:uncharacterized protein (AIM24 family)
MAEFDIIELEAQRYVRISIDKDAVRAEAGALSYMQGAIDVDAPLPSIGRAIKCMISDEPVIRPRYTGTGQIFLSASFGGYHVFDIVDEAWILEDGAYWASDDEVELGLHREPMVTSFWAGEGFIDFQTRVSGQGRVVLNAAGPVHEVELRGERLAVEGKLVIARTEGVRYGIRRPTRSIIGYWLSGEELVRTYSGWGKVLMTTTPYWNQRLLSAVSH